MRVHGGEKMLRKGRRAVPKIGGGEQRIGEKGVFFIKN